MLLAQADPDDAGTFQRPGRGSPAAIESKRNGQRAKDDTEREKGFDEQFQRVAAALPQHQCQTDVEETERQCREGQAERLVVNDPVLQTEGQ